jgi:hypothetical protein
MSNKARLVVMTEREARYWAAAATRQLHSMLEPAGLFCIGGKAEVRRTRSGKFREMTANRQGASATLIGTYTPEVNERQVFEDLQEWLKEQARRAG